MSDVSKNDDHVETRGIVIAHGFSDRLLQAIKFIPKVKLLKYDVKFAFKEP